MMVATGSLLNRYFLGYGIGAIWLGGSFVLPIELDRLRGRLGATFFVVQGVSSESWGIARGSLLFLGAFRCFDLHHVGVAVGRAGACALVALTNDRAGSK